MANEKYSQEDLIKNLVKARRGVKVDGYYAHYKHPGEKKYKVVDVAIYEETEEVCVIYKSLEMGVMWVRTLKNFTEDMEVDGKKVPRFKLII